MFVHFTIYNARHNPGKTYKIYGRKWHYSFIMGFQNANENEFHSIGNLIIWKTELKKD